jgi:deoxyadenosine/deoxycytidine kinase/DNA-binding CsgD family transcriptional regulator
MHIAVAGNIGAGKTTLTRLLAKHYKWEPHFEDVVDNPYLDDFYHQMERWSFNLQIYFLNSRFRQVLQIRQSGKNIIQDRTIYEDAHIFAPNLHAMGLMANRDYNNYTSLFELMEGLVGAPDLLIYLRSSIPNLVSQIHKRGRDYENSISIDYLSRLNERYEAWIQTYDKGKLVIIDVDDIDFESFSCEPVLLSERENEIIVFIAEGQTNAQIAETLFLSNHTINTHRKNIMAKLGVKNTAGIVMYAVKTNLVSPNKFLFAAES